MGLTRTSPATLTHALCVIALCAACGDATDTHDDGGPIPDDGSAAPDADTVGHADASTERRDARVGGHDPDADVLDDGAVTGRPDASVEGDAAARTDAHVGGMPEPCGPICAAAHPCETAFCEADRCVREAMADGTVCGESGGRICVAGTCVARGCGDGFLEPGPLPPREACDDGNLSGGDACSSACEPTVSALASRPDGSERPAGPAPALAEGIGGRVLAVWTATEGEAARVEALRLSSAGVPVDASPRVLATGLTTGWPASPTVAALPSGGWMVAWSSPGTAEVDTGIAFVRIEPTGARGRPALVHGTPRDAQYEPRLAALDDRVAVAWTDASGLREEVHARLIHPGGMPLGAELVIAEGAGHRLEPAVAARGDRWMVAWTEERPAGGTDVRARRLVHDRVVDAMPVDIAIDTGADEHSPAIAPTVGGFVVVWSAARHAGSTLHARAVTAAGVASPVTVTASGVALDPAVVEAEPGRWMVAWQHGWRRESLGWAVIGGPAPPEATTLDAAFTAAGVRSDVSLSRGTRGVWFAWSDEAGPGDPAALRSLLAFLLPAE